MRQAPVRMADGVDRPAPSALRRASVHDHRRSELRGALRRTGPGAPDGPARQAPRTALRSRRRPRRSAVPARSPVRRPVTGPPAHRDGARSPVTGTRPIHRYRPVAAPGPAGEPVRRSPVPVPARSSGAVAARRRYARSPVPVTGRARGGWFQSAAAPRRAAVTAIPYVGQRPRWRLGYDARRLVRRGEWWAACGRRSGDTLDSGPLGTSPKHRSPVPVRSVPARSPVQPRRPSPVRPGRHAARWPVRARYRSPVRPVADTRPVGPGTAAATGRRRRRPSRCRRPPSRRTVRLWNRSRSSPPSLAARTGAGRAGRRSTIPARRRPSGSCRSRSRSAGSGSWR